MDGGRLVKKHRNSAKKSESPMKRGDPRMAERRDSSEGMAELVSQLRQQREVKSVPVVKLQEASVMQ
jgi:hypothetical protein